MDKIWLKQYQPGVPETIDPDKYQSLAALFDEACQRFSQDVAFSNMGHKLYYHQLKAQSRDFAAYIQSVCKLKPGDRVALMMPNLLQYPITLLGILSAGCVVVNVNPLYTPRELGHQLKDARISAIVVLSNFAHTLEQVLPELDLKHVIVTEIGDCLSWPKAPIVNWVVKYIKKMVPKWSIAQAITYPEAMRLGQHASFEPPHLTGEDVAFLQYTGGTTGVAKGAVLTHRNMVANLEQATAWILPTLGRQKQIIVTALPLYHIFSLTANCLTFMKLGAHNVLITNPRDIAQFIKDIARIPFTAITGVNTLFNALLNHPKFAQLDFSSLLLSLGGGMAVHHSVAERWRTTTGTPLIEAYGLTEAAPAVCINPVNQLQYNGMIGLPLSSTDASIRDEQGLELAIGEVGELWIKGPQVMREYWHNPAETDKVLSSDHWLMTGDMASMTAQGFVKLVDRKKDMIIVSGFNVYPNEVEDVMSAHPGVSEVAVVGVEHAVKGEIVKAFVVRKDAHLDEGALLEYCRNNLTGYKMPKEIEFCESLPKTAVGKILRRALKDGPASA